MNKGGGGKSGTFYILSQLKRKVFVKGVSDFSEIPQTWLINRFRNIMIAGYNDLRQHQVLVASILHIEL